MTKKKKKRKFEFPIPTYARIPLIICLLTDLLAYYLPRLLDVRFAYNFAIEADTRIPLIPAFSYVYLLAFVFWTINYIYLCRQSRALCIRLCVADFVAKILCLYVFMQVPTSFEAPASLLANRWTRIFPDPESVKGVGAWLLKLIYSMDEPNNLLPSIHCFVSWLCFRPMLNKDTWAIPIAYKAFTFIFVVAIFLSTLFTKQHVVLDVFAGVFVAEAGWLLSRFFATRET